MLRLEARNAETPIERKPPWIKTRLRTGPEYTALQRLVKAGLLQSQHGTNGGYRLARAAHTISAFDVIQAIDGPLFITSCVTVRGECGQSDRCNIREPLRKVNESIEAVLKRIKISHMREEPEEAATAAGKPAELVTIV